MTRVLALCGKGGVGKTTLSALFARVLAEDHRVLAVDADPAGGLPLALGWRPAHTLDDVRREIAGEATGADATDLAAAAAYRLMEIVEPRGDLALISVGRPEEAGCFCALNTLLRQSIEALADRFGVAVVDAEAGLEQVNRRVLRSVDHLLLVSDPTAKGLQVAADLADLAGRADTPPRCELLLNRIHDEADAADLASRTSLPLAGWIPEDEAIRRFDLQARPMLELPTCAALDAVRTIAADWTA